MDLRDALTQIAEIRQQVAQTSTFRGYRAGPIALSGVFAWLAAGMQAWLIPEPARQVNLYLSLWVGAALASLVITAIAVALHLRQSTGPLTRTTTLLAVGQFLPCVLAGGLLTFVLYRFNPDSLWMLPGLWAILFSLGIFASCRLSAAATLSCVGVYYLATGVVCPDLGPGRAGVLAVGHGRAVRRRPACWPPPSSTGPWNDSWRSRSSRLTGRFAYDGLDRVIHEKARLGIVTSLATHPGGLVFNDLKELCALTDGNLSRHLQILHEAGLVQIWKGYKDNRPQTLVQLTAAGRQRFLEYISVLENVVHGRPRRRQARRCEAPQTKPAPGWSSA